MIPEITNIIRTNIFKLHWENGIYLISNPNYEYIFIISFHIFPVYIFLTKV